jgi:hypothetical protein
VSETGPEIGNLAAGSGEPGRGPVRGERSRVPEGVGVADFQVFRKRALERRSVDGKIRHVSDIQYA